LRGVFVRSWRGSMGTFAVDGAHRVAEVFQAIHTADIAVYERADPHSRKLGTKPWDQPIEGFGWDNSGEWQLIRFEEFPGDDTEGWVRVHTEFGHLLRSMGPPTRAQARISLSPLAPAMLAGAGLPAQAHVQEMLEMKRRLEEKLASLGVLEGSVPTKAATTVAPERPRPSRPSKFSAFARERLGASDDSDRGNNQASSLVHGGNGYRAGGQLYEVVFGPNVPVRQFPSLNAPPLRMASRGSRLHLFEWDHTRRWRRCNVLRAVDPQEEFEHGGQALRGVVKSDGWLMVEHPDYGILVQAVCRDAGDQEGDADQEPHSGQHTMGGSKSSEDTAGAKAAQAASVAEQVRRRMLAKQVLASVEDRPSLGEPTLMRAVRAGSYEVVRNILAGVDGMYEDPDSEDALGETAIFEACSSGRLDLVALLLICGADAAKASKDGQTPARVASDQLVQALLARWRGAPTHARLVQQAVARADPRDRQRLSDALRLDPNESASVEAEVEALEGRPRVQRPVEGQVASLESTPGGQPAAEFTSGVVPPSPPDTEGPALYRVAYKMVAVRESPNTEARALRAKSLGEYVEMYEWDETRRWRRVRVAAERDATNGELRDVDGWMLVESDRFGMLLQEIPRGGAESEADSEQQVAG